MFRTLVCVALLTLLVTPQAGYSQWRQIATLPTPANAIYFLDKQGTPKIGFASCHSDIMRTTDGGQSWKSVQNTFGAYVRDFVFWDALNGIAVCSAAPLFFRTTNGGVSWDFTSSPGPATAISYSSVTGILTVNASIGPCTYSTDSGVSWSATTVPEGQNGFAFSGPLNGIFAAHNTSFPLYWTTDGARTWKPTSFYEHVYSPIALDDQPGAFVAVGELSGQCWMSRDAGKTWTMRSALPVGALPSGCTRYHNGNIWVQSQNHGFFVSSDQGLTWHSICGPSRIADTRFYSIDSTLYASDESGGFWIIDDGRVTAVPAEVSFVSSPIVLKTSACGIGKAGFAIVSTACYEQVDTVIITGSPRIQMSPSEIKRPTALGSSLGFSFTYTPTPNRYYDTSFVHIAWGSDGRIHDTTIPVYAEVATGAAASTLSLNTIKHSSCDAFDTAVDLRTMSCDTVQIVKCNLIDSSIFHVYNIPALPFRLYPRNNFNFRLRASALPAGTYTALIHIQILGVTGITDSTFRVTLTISGAPSPEAGPAQIDPAVICDQPDTVMWIHNPYCGAITLERARSASPFLTVIDSIFPITIRGYDSIPLHLHAVPKDGHFVWLLFCSFKVAGQAIDTVLYITSDGRVVHLSTPTFRATPRTICDIIDTIVWIYAPKCLGARVDWLHLDHPQVQLLDTAFPVTMNANDSMPVHLRILPSHQPLTATLAAQFVEDGITLDTTYALTVKVKTATKPAPGMTPVPLRFGLTPWCSGKSLPLKIFNNKCQAMRVIGIAWVISDSQITYDSIPLPLTIPSGATDSIIFRYKPSAIRPTTATIRITFDLADLTQDTVIFITGTGIDTGIALIEPNLLTYDTISKCVERIDTTYFNNVSCDTMLLESFADWQQNGYEVLSPQLPLTVQPGGTIPIVVRLKRRVDGAVNDSLDFAYYSTKPPHTPLSARLKLFGQVVTPLVPLQVEAAAFDSVHLTPCSGFDSFIVVRNTNVCDSVTVTSLVGDGITTRTTLPKVLGPGEQDTIRFFDIPARDTAVTILSIEGTLLDTSFSIRSYRANARAVTCTPTSFAAFVAPLCHTASDSLLLSPGGCDSATIDRIEIEPTSSNFKIAEQFNVPFTLSQSSRVRLIYDPSLGTSDTASLYLHSSSGALDLRIPLRGITTTLQTARFSIRNDTNTQVTNLAAGDATNFTLFTEDVIPDSLGLSEIDCDLSLNSDVLTLAGVQPGAHFTLVNSSQQGGRTSLSLKRNDAASIAATSVLATLRFSGAVSDTIATGVALSSVRFNPSQSDYEQCILLPQIDPANISAQIDPSCSRDFLSGVMAGRGILSSIHVHPTVLNGNDELMLDLDAAKATQVTVRFIDILGEEGRLVKLAVPAGHSSQVIPFGKLPSGLKFVEISGAGAVTMQRVVVTR